ncbi:TPA: hypothetical protein U4W48_001034 [Streptococcus agalactiae]|nr:hypothetical protein [Streptococcus agalactiae]HEN3089748.1 hypothetical protein [Streptococcus agalactiae]
MTQLSDLDRIKIAKQEYEPYGVGDQMVAGSETVGTVREVVTDDFGQKAYVIQSVDKKEVSVIYRGSEGPGTPGSAVDCLDNDFIITSLHVKINI